jgi:hypothetical protein
MKNKTKNKTNMKTLIRKIVREEVAMAIHEVISELKVPQQPTKPVKKKSFAKNSVLNDVLNETANDDSDWETMGGSKFTTERMNELMGGQYADMMKDTPQQVPSSDPMAQFLNKDYREVLDRTEEKSKQKYGK